jgi:hypothetical protein
LAAELKASFGVDSELLSGEKGDFEVVVDGKQFSPRKNCQSSLSQEK